MKNGKMLKLIGALMLCAGVFSCISAAEAVEIKSYMPVPQVIYTDDDFNNQTGETPVGSTAGDKRAEVYTGSWSVQKEEGNSYITSTTTYDKVAPIGTKAIKGDRMTVSFDVKSSSAPKMYLFSGNQRIATVNFWSATQGQVLLGSDSTKKSAVFNITANTFVNVTLTFNRTLKADGSGYNISIEQVFIGGNAITLNTLDGAVLESSGWWTENGDNTIILQAVAAGISVDNLLIYCPSRAIGTSVAIPDNMPRVKTLIADDGFENRPVDQRANITPTTKIPYPVKIGVESSDGSTFKENSWGSYVRQDDNGNKYLTLNNDWRSGPYIAGGKDVDRLAVSFEIGHNSLDTNTCSGTLYIGDRAPIAFEIYSGTNMKLFYNTETGNASSGSAELVYKAAADMHRVDAVFKRTESTDGGYKVYLESIYVDGSEVTKVKGVEFKDIDWWSADTAHAFRVKCIRPCAKFDNILVYEPMNFQVLDASADGGKITLNFSGSPAQSQTGMTASLINLTTGNAVDLTGIVPSVSGSSIVTDISSLNLSDKDVYQFSVSGVTDKYGAAAPTFTQKFGKGFEAVDFSGSITLANYGNTVMEGTLIAAYYRNGELVGTAIIGEQSIPVDISKTISCDISHVSALNPDAVSVFIWQMTSGRMIPVCSNLIRTTQQ